jgi:hypothetical protein
VSGEGEEQMALRISYASDCAHVGQLALTTAMDVVRERAPEKTARKERSRVSTSVTDSNPTKARCELERESENICGVELDVEFLDLSFIPVKVGQIQEYVHALMLLTRQHVVPRTSDTTETRPS